MRFHSSGHRRYARVIAVVGLTIVLAFAGGCGGSDDAAGVTATAGPAAAKTEPPGADPVGRSMMGG
jgi:hypothetical protein